MALVAFAPGSTQAFELTGRARLTSDRTLLSPMSIEGKAPLLATLITVDDACSYDSQALRRARVWDADRASAGNRPNPAAALTAHIRLNQQKTPAAPAFPITAELTQKALESDYKVNLY
jgi:uncharacterized protein